MTFALIEPSQMLQEAWER